jgi:hypothetical protein
VDAPGRYGGRIRDPGMGSHVDAAYNPGVRLLWLGSSNDLNPLVDEQQRMPHIAARIIHERTGNAPELEIRPLVPSPRMAELAGDWVDEYDPELVCLYVGAYFYSYRSVPLRVRRRFGPIGKPFAKVGWKAAESRTLGERRWFHFLRGAALRTIGGDAQYTSAQVFSRIEATTRRIIANEDRVLLVRGPTDQYERKLPKGMTTHRSMTKKLEQMCDTLHVAFLGWDDPVLDLSGSGHVLGDGLHYKARAHALIAEPLGEALAKAWLEAHPVPEPPQATTSVSP